VPVVEEIVPTARAADPRVDLYRYTFMPPAASWFQSDFDASSWKEGPGGFGRDTRAGLNVRTEWKSSDIWLRRVVELSAEDLAAAVLLVNHDDGAEVYVNGVLAALVPGDNHEHDPIPLTVKGRAALRVGKNLLAVHCHNDQGEQGIDVGLGRLKKK
jgi:hypothetical protein